MVDIFSDSSINEIIVHEDEGVFYEQDGYFKAAPFALSQYSSDQDFFNEVTKDFQKAPAFDHPISSGRWKGFRVQVVNPPACKHKRIIQLRRLSKMERFGSFKSTDWSVTEDIQKLIENMFKEKENFLIVGSTGSGKTTLLQSLLFTFCKKDRCVILEDTDELYLPNEMSSGLTTFDSSTEEIKDVDLDDLVKASLRLRPDRIIMGEMRGREAASFLLMLSTGHSGSGATLHAKSAQEALYRLEMLVQMGERWKLGTIRRLIHCSLKYIILTDKKDGCPYLKSIHKITGLEESGFLIHPIFENEPLSTRRFNDL